jgi:hypothetical protein
MKRILYYLPIGLLFCFGVYIHVSKSPNMSEKHIDYKTQHVDKYMTQPKYNYNSLYNNMDSIMRTIHPDLFGYKMVEQSIKRTLEHYLMYNTIDMKYLVINYGSYQSKIYFPNNRVDGYLIIHIYTNKYFDL